MGNKPRIGMYYGDKPNSGDYDNGVWLDILKVPFLKDIDDAKDFDIIIRTLWLDSIGWSKQIKTRWPNKILIGLSDHPLSTHISRMPPTQQVAYLEDIQYLDGIMALTEEERQWYTVAAPSKPVIKAGLPFPFESYREKYGKFIGSEKKFIGLGVGASDNDRNFITSLMIFQRLKLEFPEIQGVFMSIPSNLLKTVVPLCDAVPDVFIHQRDGMESFYDVLSQCKFVINMADRNTPGRLQGEAAFFGIPVIGSNRLELQNELYPDLSVSPFCAQMAVDRGRELLLHPERGEIMGSNAIEKLQKYNYTKSKAKFNRLLKVVGEKIGG